MATDWNLITKYVRGEISPKEQQQLQDWLKEDAVHQALLDKVEQDWKASSTIYHRYTPDLNQAWQAIEERLDDTPIVGLSTRTARKTWWLRAAAIAVAVVGLVYLVQQLNQPGGWGLAEISTDYQERQQLTLVDGTQVWLNENTKLRHPEEFTDSTRIVYLEGEAFFDVARNENQPFQIFSDKAVTQVLGTSFEVSTRDTAVTVTVASEVVALFERDDPTDRVVLRSGNQGTLSRTSGKITKADTFSRNTLAWHTRQLTFNNQSLAEVGQLLEDVYQRKIKIDTAIQSLKLTAEFDNQSLEEVLEVIAITLDIEYELTRETVYLKKIEK